MGDPEAPAAFSELRICSASAVPTRSLPMSFAIYPSLKDKVVIVTGGESGIGEEIVRAFAAQGSRVGFVDIDATRGDQLSAELHASEGRVRFEACDLCDIGALERAFAALDAAHGSATILVNNAARDDRHAWEDVTPEY